MKQTFASLYIRALLRIILPYVVFACLWILLADRLFEALNFDLSAHTQWSLYKSWAFVFVTGLLLALLLRAELRTRESENTCRMLCETAESALARDQAREADRLKSVFLATMSHELQTPLNSIIGFTGIILQGLAGPLNPEQRRQLEMVQSSAKHLQTLINDVLEISRIEAGQLVLTRRSFDLGASIEKVLGIVMPLAEKKALALRVDIAPEIGMFVSDEQRVEQILLKLLSNAIKFTERGEITLKASVEPNTVCISITDTGIGIKEEDLLKLFQPFQQIDTGLARNHEGIGLGLTICQRLAELLGGKLRVESEWGKGSTFTVLLPFGSQTHQQLLH